MCGSMALKINLGSHNITEYPVYQATEPSSGNIRAKSVSDQYFFFKTLNSASQFGSFLSFLCFLKFNS